MQRNTMGSGNVHRGQAAEISTLYVFLITNEAQPAKQYRPRLRTPSLASEGAGEGWGGGMQDAVIRTLPPSPPSPASRGRSLRLG